MLGARQDDTQEGEDKKTEEGRSNEPPWAHLIPEDRKRRSKQGREEVIKEDLPDGRDDCPQM
jgi:hypothetical protein